MFDNLNVAIVASDKDFNVIYQNKKCRELFKNVFGKSDFSGAAIHECHSPVATEKVKKYYEDYTRNKRELDYYIVDASAGKTTVVNVPFYEREEFKGVVEFIFKSSLT